MTPLMETLYRYLVETKLDAFLLQYPEYPDYLRCAGEKEGSCAPGWSPGRPASWTICWGSCGWATPRSGWPCSRPP